MIGTRIVTSAANAALANGMFGHADETDDTHPPSLTHPGTSVIPAALAIGERNRLAGKTVLRAIALGCDVCARILLTQADALFAIGSPCWRNRSQLFRAAAAAGLTQVQFDRCATCSRLHRRAHQRAVHDVPRSRAYREGLRHGRHAGAPWRGRLALMVAHGWTGVEDIFSGERDFFFTFAPRRSSVKS